MVMAGVVWISIYGSKENVTVLRGRAYSDWDPMGLECVKDVDCHVVDSVDSDEIAYA